MLEDSINPTVRLIGDKLIESILGVSVTVSKHDKLETSNRIDRIDEGKIESKEEWSSKIRPIFLESQNSNRGSRKNDKMSTLYGHALDKRNIFQTSGK